METFEFSQVTTRGGDRGETSLADGERRRKDDLLFHTLGTIDELSSHIGLLRGYLKEKSPAFQSLFRRRGGDLRVIQERLQVIGGLLAVPRRSKFFPDLPKIGSEEIEELEKWEYQLMQETEVPQRFIQPGENLESAAAHIARSVCRRSERWLVTCIRERGMNQLIGAQQYLNRLADYLFVAALWYDQHKEEKE